MNKLSVAATMAILGLSAGVTPVEVAPLLASPARVVSLSGSGRRRKPHHRGRCTRATPAGVARSRANKTRRERNAPGRLFRKVTNRLVGVVFRNVLGQTAKRVGATDAELAKLAREIKRSLDE
jgi:hypothetical protein